MIPFIIAFTFIYCVVGFFTVGPISDLSKSPLAQELSKDGGWLWGIPVWPYVVVAQLIWAWKNRVRSSKSTNLFKIITSSFKG